MGKETIANNDNILDGAKRLDDTILDGAKRVDDDILAGVSGGGGYIRDSGRPLAPMTPPPRKTTSTNPQQSHFCIKCNKDTMHDVFSGGRMVCSECGTPPIL